MLSTSRGSQVLFTLGDRRLGSARAQRLCSGTEVQVLGGLGTVPGPGRSRVGHKHASSLCVFLRKIEVNFFN